MQYQFFKKTNVYKFAEIICFIAGQKKARIDLFLGRNNLTKHPIKIKRGRIAILR